MVASWPFTCLSLGEHIQVDNFQAVLDGLDFLNNQTVWPRRCRLQVLNLHQVQHDFWEGCPGTQYGVDSPGTKPGEKEPTTGQKTLPLRVLAKCTLMYVVLKDYNSFLCNGSSLEKVSCQTKFLGWFIQRNESADRGVGSRKTSLDLELHIGGCKPRGMGAGTLCFWLCWHLSNPKITVTAFHYLTWAYLELYVETSGPEHKDWPVFCL